MDDAHEEPTEVDDGADEVGEPDTVEPEPEPEPETALADDAFDLKADDGESGETYSESDESSSELSYSYSDMSVDEVDPSEWRVFHEDEDEIAMIKFEQREKTPELTEKEKDAEFQRLRKASRPPLYLTKLTDRSAPTGSTIKLQCTVEAQEVTVRWMKDDQPVERSERLQTSAADGLYTLTIKNLKHKDAGEYKILAKNRGGEIPSIAHVRVYDAMKPKCQLPFFVKVRDYFHHALNDLVIECQIMFQQEWSIPTVTWLKDGDPIVLDQRIGATYEGDEIFQLNIYDPTPADSGRYTCIAENEAGRAQISHTVDFVDKVPYMRLPGITNADPMRKLLTDEEIEERKREEQRIKREAQERLAGGGKRGVVDAHEPYESESFVIRDSKNKLTWAGQLHNITTTKGAIVKMTCSANGPLPMFKWQRNGRAIDFGDHVKLMNSGAIGQIVINGVTRKDAGEYTCTAKNSHNELKTTCVLKVITLPSEETTPATFTRAVKEFYDIRADDLVLEVNVHGVPKPTIKWLKDGEEITLGEKLLINREPNGVYQLCIHKPVPADCGVYECQAVNEAGTAKVSHEVSFTAKDKLIHVQHIEHADYFKRRLEEKEAASLLLTAEPAPPVEEQQQQQQQQQKAQSQAPASSEAVEAAPASATTAEGDIETSESATGEVPAEVTPEASTEPAAAAPKPKFKAMPGRRRFEDGPVEPFVIRDSKNRLMWETKLKNQTAPAGNTMKLTCSVTGPQPTWRWMKNGKPLVWSKNVINATKAEFGCVRITPTTVADSGEYTALAKNSFGEIECTCTVNVFATETDIETVPTFTRVIDYYDSVVDDLILEVHVRGVPDPKLSWERDGVEFTNETDRVIISRQGDGVYRLSIHNPEKLDGGRWVVTAKNRAGEEKLKHSVTFKGREFYQSQLTHGIYHADKQVTRSEEDGIAYGTRSRSVSRAPSVAHQVAGPEPDISAVVAALQSVEATTEEAPAVGTEAESGEAAPEVPDAPVVKKKAEPKQWRKNLQGLLKGRIPGPIAEEPTKHKVLEVKQKLYFEANLKNQTVSEGSHIKLVCSCVGPQPTIKWFKNNIPLVWSKNVKNDTKLGVGAVHIISAELADSGTYKCTASNTSGEVETTCKVIVYPVPEKQYVAPSFVRNVKEHYDIQTNDLVLEVNVRGNPMPSVKWLRDGIDLQDPTGEKFFPMREPGGVFKLTIHDPQAKDEGQYACEATNVVGKDMIRHGVRRIVERKIAESHVFGIAYHDPNVMKHGVYEEPPKPEPAPRPHREFVFLEDGTYYIRGQTPEHLWEWETDTSAPSEYEEYVSPEPGQEPEEEPVPEEPVPEPEPAPEEKKPSRSPSPDFLIKTPPPPPKQPDPVEADDEEDEDEDEEEEEEAPPPPPKRGPKIKKLRKKRVKQPVQEEVVAPVAEEVAAVPTIPEPAPKVEEVVVATAEPPKEGEEAPVDKDKLRKERYLRLFPELNPDDAKRVDARAVLRFGSTLHDINIVEGKPVRLFCTVLGSKADFRWYKNGEPMEFTKQIKNLSDAKEGTGVVAFNKAAREDTGDYEVVVKDKSGAVIRGTCKLNVLPAPVRIPVAEGEAPRYVRCMTQHYDLRVDDLVLETQIKGTGPIKVEWYLDGIIIPNNEKYIQIREPHGIHKLCIHNPQIRDNGRYMVKAMNDFGTEELKYTLRFEGKAAAMPMYHMHHADKRRPLYEEEKAPEPRQHREVVFLEDGSYYLKGQTPERFWEWETDTDAESEYEEYVPGDTESEEEPSEPEEEEKEPAEAEGEPAVKPASPSKPAQEPLVAEGAEEAEPEEEEEEVEPPPKPIKRGPKIKKLRRKLPKQPSPEKVPEVEKPREVPRQREPQPTYGEPKMKLSQLISSGKSLAPPEVPRVKRWKKPIEVEFISHLRSGTIKKGKNLTLNCCCSDAQKIEVTWWKDDEPLVMGPRCRSDVTRQGYCTLDLVDLRLEDSGVYKCVAKTTNGTATDSCRITVFELEKKAEVELVPPTFLTPLRELYHPTTNDLHLEIRVRGNPVPTFRWMYDGIPIPHRTEKYEIFNQHYYEQGTKVTTVQLIINDPQLRDSGKYTLICTNDVKTVEMSRQISIPLRFEQRVQAPKKRMDDVVVENEAPRVLPKPPTPEPEPVVEEPPPEPVEGEGEEQEAVEEEKEEEEEED
uniref:Ig-like domain-containing protein n=1 Tax=Anopheles farauti TaxID=69004 RepID=A0A182QIC7_9DIPT